MHGHEDVNGWMEAMAAHEAEIARLDEESRKLREQVARVRAVHPLERWMGRSVCGSCRDAWEDPMAYPCPTIAALDGE